MVGDEDGELFHLYLLIYRLNSVWQVIPVIPHFWRLLMSSRPAWVTQYSLSQPKLKQFCLKKTNTWLGAEAQYLSRMNKVLALILRIP